MAEELPAVIATSDVVDVDNDEALLRFSLKHRLNIAAKLAVDNKPPEDEDKLAAHMSNLKDIEKVALSRLKIKSDETTAKSSAEAAKLVAVAVLAQISPNDNPFINHEPTEKREAPEMPEGMGDEFTFVEGETAIGNRHNFDVDSFMGMFDQDGKKKKR